MRLVKGTVLAVIGALTLWGCGGGGSTTTNPSAPSTPSPTPSSQTMTVSIVGSSGSQAFQPNPVSANPGDSVVFRNTNATTHHIVLDDGSADLGMLASGATSSAFVVKSSSAASFHCVIHPTMVGSINGQEAPTPPPCPTPGYGC